MKSWNLRQVAILAGCTLFALLVLAWVAQKALEAGLL